MAAVSTALVVRRDDMARRWLARWASSPLWVSSAFPEGLEVVASGLLETLGTTLGDPDLVPGSAALREVDKRFAFLGGFLDASGVGPSGVIAFVATLRDLLAAETPPGLDGAAARAEFARLADWFMAVAAEGQTRSREEALAGRQRDALEQGTPVVSLTPGVPAAFLVGEPDAKVLDTTLGRLLLAVVRVGARVAILDATGLTQADDPRVLCAITSFSSHRKVAGRVKLVLVGLTREGERAWRAAIDARCQTFFADAFDQAVTVALEAASLAIVARGARQPDDPGA
ncbi:MAG: hypothetical protein EXR73_11675 [Myxococcales bacterium]|nr:hypothetical protein [Myxococcales bacterium]